MDQLIPIMNQIQDAMSSVDLAARLDLPQIAVVGGQSSGKSSLLESLVGRSFLPTGAGVVTRRPLLLRLVHAEREWAEFQHRPGEVFELDQVRAEILAETERLCGDRGIRRDAIALRVMSPKVLSLTLIDLPGVARVPIGDQPADIEAQIRALALEHVSSPRCLILAVAAANADLATADGLSLARHADPEGRRTLGVLTKLDLAGPEALEVLEGRVYPLAHGFHAVLGRSPEDLRADRGLEEHLRAEERFFRARFPSVLGRCGAARLSGYLRGVLLEHIRAELPALRGEVLRVLDASEQELRACGEALPRQDRGAFLLNVLTAFARRFGEAVEGRLEPGGLYGGGLHGRARMDYVFRDVFARTVLEEDALAGLGEGEIRVALRNSAGVRSGSLFLPERAFEQLARRQIARLEAPGVRCAELVFEELERVCLAAAELPELRRFPGLRDRALEAARGVLRAGLEPCTAMIRGLVKIELSYVNTAHPRFIGSAGAMREAQEKHRAREAEGAGRGKDAQGGPQPQGLQETLQSREMMEVDIVKSLLESYLGIVKRSVADSVPKAVMHFLVGPARDRVQHECVGRLYREDLLDELLQEQSGMQERRARCQERLQAFRRMLDVILQLRDFPD